MNRTRYRLPAIAVVSVIAYLVLLRLVPSWAFLSLVVGAVASFAEIARHYGDFRHIARNLMRH